ncbi:MAG: FG-GAP-like repeat-containing protein [Gemmataceae bacterium]
MSATHIKLRVEELESRALPASPVIMLNQLINHGKTLSGFEDFAHAGFSVSGAGDVNGDGYSDFIIGGPGTDAGGSNRGEVYVLFGGPNVGGNDVPLSNLATSGFTIRGFEDGAAVGFGVSGAGDVNGDGYDDLIVGAPSSAGTGSQAGAAYVIFGGPNLIGTTMMLNALGAGGFTINGFENGARAGWSVSGAGDVNGDGFADVLIGAPFANSGGELRGESYVVFGGPSLGGTTVTLNALSAGGFTLQELEDGGYAGKSVSGAGDVNGDGFADMIIGAPYADAGGTNRGKAYVVFGGPNLGGTTVTLDSLDTGGFTLNGFEDSAAAGFRVGDAGDVNGDGFADVIVGAPYARGGGANRGEAYVVFGGKNLGGSTLQLNKLGDGGFKCQGFEDNASAGYSVSGAGDVNGDGFADVIIGAPLTDAGGNKLGEAYVVFGGTNRRDTTVALDDLGTGGLTFRGFQYRALVGASVSGAGDVNGDGFSDILIGAPDTNVFRYGTFRGEAYMIYAPQPPLYAVGSGPGAPATVRVYDAKTGNLRAQLLPFANFSGGVHVAMGDVNSDGAADVIVGAGPGGGPAVKVYDGRTFAEIASFFAYDSSFTGGVFVAVGDINGDGKAEVITGAGPGGGPHVRVFSSDDPTQPLASFFAYTPNFAGGVAVAAGDVNGDGKADIITGAGPSGGPHVRAFSGADPSTILLSFFAYASTFTGGVSVAAGDVNGDGKADMIAGAGAGGGPQVKVFSNAGALLQSFFAYTPAFTGGVQVATADVDGDGRADIMTGAGPGGGPHVKAFRGTDIALLKDFFAYDPGFLGGVFVGGA